MKVKLGLVGFGTVGTGVVRTLNANRESIEKQAGAELDLVSIADIDIETDRGVDLGDTQLTKDAASVLSDPEIDIVIELVGGIDVAKEFILQALKAGKHVVSANKALLAECGDELFSAAREAGKAIYFEGAVGGGIPLIQTLRGALAAADIHSIYTIINGTANYILTEMADKDRDFQDVLKDAQEQGYAEADPTFDVEGIDTAHKICLLASTAFGLRIPYGEIPVEGITRLTPEDLQYAAEMGYKVKLLAIARDLGGSVEIRVHPTMIPESNILASVTSVFNGVLLKSDPLDSTFLHGRGAGGEPTAGAVVADAIQLARNIAEGSAVVDFIRPDFPTKPVKPMAEVETAYYLRMMAVNQAGVLAKISAILGAHNISIASVIQKESRLFEPDVVPIVLMTYEAREEDMKTAVAEIERLEIMKDEPLLIRVERNLD